VGSERSGSLESLRERNRARVLDAMRELGVASRAAIARHTGLSRSTVSSLVSELQAAGLVVDRRDGRDAQEKTSGRPPLLIALDRSAGIAVGIDFGKRHLAVAAADLSHTILAESRREMPEGYDSRSGLDDATVLVDEVLDSAGVDRGSVIGVGMGLPGPINLETGTVGSSAILPGWVGMQVAEQMSERLGLPVLVDNDANLGALSELHWGGGRGSSNLAYLKVSTGIGAGLVIDGRLFRGASGTAGEIGHTMIDETGPICRCGSRGCLETLAAGPAIVDVLRPSLGEDLSIEQVLEQAANGDTGCRRAIGDAGRYIGSALADLCNLVNPERIVVGGSIGTVGNVLLDPMRETLRHRAIPSAGDDVEIVPSALGDRAELLGTVALVLYEGKPAAAAVAGAPSAEPAPAPSPA
jgi:predicted NBD/HSP70 family sugar kinase/biotin operon repressor